FYSTSSHTICPLLHLHTRHPPPSTLFPYTTLFRSVIADHLRVQHVRCVVLVIHEHEGIAIHVGEGGLAAQQFDFRQVVIGVEARSEEHTSELQSRENLVCRLLLEKKKSKNNKTYRI